jgi:hypothetical protein
LVAAVSRAGKLPQSALRKMKAVPLEPLARADVSDELVST